MAEPTPTDTLEQKYAELSLAFPGIPIDRTGWGSDAVDMFLTLSRAGPLCRQSAAGLIQEKMKIYLTKEARGVGGGWHENIFGDRWITLDRGEDPWYRLVGLAHEGLHLQQPIRKRCSVEGEYDAWRFGYRLRNELASLGAVMPMTADDATLAAMPDHPTRENLKTAQGLMQQIAGPYYLIGKTPLQAQDWPTFFLAAFLLFYNIIIGRGSRI